MTCGTKEMHKKNKHDDVETCISYYLKMYGKVTNWITTWLHFLYSVAKKIAH